jgi:hypothetical protein
MILVRGLSYDPAIQLLQEANKHGFNVRLKRYTVYIDTQLENPLITQLLKDFDVEPQQIEELF